MRTRSKKSHSIVKDQLDLLEAFGAAEVDFLVIGGHAVGAHAKARYTKDIDLFIRNDKANAERVWKALVALGAPLSGMSEADFHEKPAQIFHMGVEPDRIDLLQSIAGVEFDEAWRDAVPGNLGGVPVRFISREHLIQNKQFCVAVYCAAAEGARPVYRAVAEELGRALAGRGWGLIYGGAKVGLMGAVADATLAAGGHVVGVIPQVLVDFEVAHEGVTELHVVDTMHTRKALMAERASAFLVMPGGFGTFEEMFEVLAWQTLKLHTKPVVLLNVEGFYDTLLTFLDVCDREGMLRGNLGRLLVAATVDEALGLCGAVVER